MQLLGESVFIYSVKPLVSICWRFLERLVDLKVVQEYRAKYKGIARIMEMNPKILDLAHSVGNVTGI